MEPTPAPTPFAERKALEVLKDNLSPAPFDIHVDYRDIWDVQLVLLRLGCDVDRMAQDELRVTPPKFWAQLS